MFVVKCGPIIIIIYDKIITIVLTTRNHFRQTYSNQFIRRVVEIMQTSVFERQKVIVDKFVALTVDENCTEKRLHLKRDFIKAYIIFGQSVTR